MSNIKLDLSKFKHVKSNDKSTTLRHADGHELTISHKSLSKPNQEQLQAMANLSKGDKKATDKGEAKQDEQLKDAKFAGGGTVRRKMYADTEETVSAEDSAPVAPVSEAIKFDPNRPADTNPQEDYKNAIANEAEAFPGADPRSIEMLASNDLSMKKDQEVKHDTFNANQAEQQKQRDAELQNMQNATRVQQGMAPLADQGSDSVQMPTADKQAPVQAPNGQSQPLPQASNPQNNYAQDMMKGINTQIAGQNLAAKTAGEQGKAEQTALEENRSYQTKAHEALQSAVADNETLYKNVQQDIKDGYIDPNKYWTGYKAANGEMVPGHSRLAAAIGILIAGFNPTNKPNAAIELIQNQINQSLDAQKTNLNSQHNLLRANMDHFKNINDAYTATKMFYNDDAINRLQQAAAVAKGPMAQAAAMGAIGQLQQQQGQLKRQLDMSTALTKLSQGQGQNPQDPSNTKAAEALLQQMYQFAPEQAKILQERIVPGVGVASIPVPEAKREKLLQHQELNEQANHLLKFIKEKGVNMNPLDADVVAAKQMALGLQSAIREGKLGTVYKEGEQPLLDKFVNEDPLSFFGHVESPKALSELIRSNNVTYNQVKKSVGIQSGDLPGAQNKNAQALQWAQANSKDPRAAKILKTLGK